MTLDLDPITSDALTQAAKARKCGRDRLAYELVQQGLGIGVSLSAAPHGASESDDYTDDLASRFTSNYKPQGRP